jgi:cardiolipin synthase (CMP-forming)
MTTTIVRQGAAIVRRNSAAAFPRWPAQNHLASTGTRQYCLWASRRLGHLERRGQVGFTGTGKSDRLPAKINVRRSSSSTPKAVTTRVRPRSAFQNASLLFTKQARYSSSPTPPPPSSPSPTPKPSKILTQPLESLSSLTPHENIYTIPNLLTFSRLFAAPVVGYLVLNHQPFWALTLFAYAGITDLLDGYLARRFNSFTVVGSVIDPMADKLLMTICVACLGYTSIMPWWAATIIIGRDVGLAISAIYWRWISLPPPKTMTRYWDFSLPSAEVHPTEISKINTLLQLLLVGNAMVLPVLPEALVDAWNLWGVFEGWCGLVSATTVWSGLSYVGNKEAVKIVSQEDMRKVLDAREAKVKDMEEQKR